MADHRLKVTNRAKLKPEALLAAKPAKIIKPSAAQIDNERPFWGPNPDPLAGWIEEQVYQRGLVYLQGMLRAVTGKTTAIAKAEGDWGDIARIFASKAPVEDKLSSWESLIEQFSNALFPEKSLEAAAAAWSLRTNLFDMLGPQIKGITEAPGEWQKIFPRLPDYRQEAVAWQKAAAAEHMTKLTTRARQAIRENLLQSSIANVGTKKMEQKLMEAFGGLNRDWRRVALTETAIGIQNARLQQVAGLGGGWEAVWRSTPNACPYCWNRNNQVFEIVPADAPNKNSKTQVWPGKTNVGRSAHLYRKDGSKREPDELWHPCIPAHPNCCCQWTVRRKLTAADHPLVHEVRRKRDADARKRAEQDAEFNKYVSSRR
jgi:hypothetical protein